MFKDDALKVEQLYQQITDLLSSYAHLTPSVNAYKDVLFLLPSSDFEQLQYIDMSGVEEIRRLNRFNELAIVLQVLKRVYHKGLAFQNLDHHLSGCLDSQVYEGEIQHESAGSFYLLYWCFPHLMQQYREQMGNAMVQSWLCSMQRVTPRFFNQKELAERHDFLLDVLLDIDLTPMQLIRILNREDAPQSIIITALQEEKMNIDWLCELDKILQTMMSGYLGESLTFSAVKMLLIRPNCRESEKWQANERFGTSTL